MADFVKLGLFAAVLSTPTLGTINKHAAALPANRGLFPYFWAKLHGTPQGVSYHLVTPGIDEGPILVQDRNIPHAALGSMTQFYLYVFGAFPERMTESVSRLVRRCELAQPADVRPSYHGLPTRHEVARFREKGGRIIALSDMVRAATLVRRS
jgi:methionyl-tRNA formyltransferase